MGSPRESEFAHRYINREQARHLYGELADTYARFQMVGDPLADAAAETLIDLGAAGHRMVDRFLRQGRGAVPEAPEALRQLFEQVSTVPEWADLARCDVGARTHQRIGPAQLMVLSAWSLMNGYHSAPAVKPLALTGQLTRMAPRRLAETARFVTDVTEVGGMRRWGAGFRASVRVRLIHAFVRRAMLRSERWDRQAWGVPINQGDMVGTIIEFSLLMLRGARAMGFRFTEEEAESVVHLWRYAGWVNGVDPRLLEELSSEPRGERFAELIKLVQPGPDQDSVELAAALRAVAEQRARSGLERTLAPWVVRLHDGFTWSFNGDLIASNLRVPNRHWRYAIYPARALIGSMEAVRRRLPGGTGLARWVGHRLVHAQVARLLEGDEPTFRPVSQPPPRPARAA